MAAPSVRRRAARHNGSDRRHDTVEDEADDAHVNQRENDLADVRGIPGVPDEKADADAADQHFGRDDRKPGKPDADAQATEDVRRRRWDHDLEEEFEAIEPQHCGDVAVRSEEHTSELQSRQYL